MKKKFAVLAMVALIAGCSSTGNKGLNPPSDATVPVKDMKITTSFVDEGIKISYTLSGNLESITVIGVSPAWKRNHDIIAEADAMDKLVKFVYGKNVSTDRRVKIISKALDQASDLTLNKFKSNEGTLETNSKSLEEEIVSTGNGEESQKQNTAKRNARIVDETVVNAVQTITSSGRLVGVRKINEAVKDDGKTYVAYYYWSKKDMAVVKELQREMSR